MLDFFSHHHHHLPDVTALPACLPAVVFIPAPKRPSSTIRQKISLVVGSGLAQESAQYSAMAVELSDPDTVGTALTLQMALGFTVTVVAIFSIPLIEVRFFLCIILSVTPVVYQIYN